MSALDPCSVSFRDPADAVVRVPESALVALPASARDGAQALLEALVECGVDTIFGYPGGAALPLYDALYGGPRLRHMLVRHEQAAVHAAEATLGLPVG